MNNTINEKDIINNEDTQKRRDEVNVYISKEVIPALISVNVGSYYGTRDSISVSFGEYCGLYKTASVEFEFNDNGECDCHVKSSVSVDNIDMTESSTIRIRALAGDTKMIINKIKDSHSKLIDILTKAGYLSREESL